MDQLTQGQVDFNRRVAQALLAIDELSATTSEEHAARS
jgi:hypothetical protein